MKIFVGALVILALQRHLGREHRHEMTRLEEELNRELSKAKKEFTRESRGEVKFEKILEKRHKLEKKADKAYAKFKEKAAEKNRLDQGVPSPHPQRELATPPPL